MCYLKEKFIILVIICLSLLSYSCETTQLASKKTLIYNKSQLLETIEKDEDPNAQKNNLIERDDKIFKVGLLLPLSGEFYQIGKSLLDSAQLALEKTNNKNLEFYIVDTGKEDQLFKNLSYLISNDIDLDMTIEHYVYAQGDRSVSVEHFKYLRGDHVWFNSTFQGYTTSELVWNFVSKFDINGLR